MLSCHHKSHIRKSILTLLALLFCLCQLCACTDAPSAEPAADAVVFTDVLGREITLESVPKRTACLLGSFADIWMLAGGTVCAAAEDAWEDFGLTTEDAVNIGGAHSPNTELLLSASPDFVRFLKILFRNKKKQGSTANDRRYSLVVSDDSEFSMHGSPPSAES